MKSSLILKHLAVAVVAAGLVQCGSSGTSSSSSSSSTGTATVSNLTQLPSITDIVGESASASMTSLALTKSAVSGTPPILSEITASSADTVFWNGLLADINALADDDVIPQETFEDFWHGESACRMAQNVGYSFQNIQQAGTSLCYMKNAPGASSGVEIVSGDVEAADLFAQTSTDKLVNVQISGEQGEDANQIIFIKVYGTDSTEGANGFAADLWFCDQGESTPRGYEQVRVNTTTGVITQHNVDNNDDGDFVMDFTGKLTEDSDGNITFDRTQQQSATMTFASNQFGSFKGNVSVLGTTLTSKGYNTSEFDSQTQTNKNYIISEYSGTGSDDLRFLSAGVANQWTNGNSTDSFDAAVEFQSPAYVYNSELDVLADVTDYDFAGDSFFEDLTISESELDTSDYACSGLTPDIVVSMDMGNSAFLSEVVSLCENSFEEMNFCDGENVQTARNRIFQSNFFGEPE